jgi:hypothetical protein
MATQTYQEWIATRTPEQLEARRAARRRFAKSPKGRDAREERKNKVRAWLEAEREAGCMDCGLKEPAIMDFDHVPERGPKLFSLGAGVLTKPWASLRAERAKCDVVCPNCHRRRTLARLV